MEAYVSYSESPRTERNAKDEKYRNEGKAGPFDRARKQRRDDNDDADERNGSDEAFHPVRKKAASHGARQMSHFKQLACVSHLGTGPGARPAAIISDSNHSDGLFVGPSTRIHHEVRQ